MTLLGLRGDAAVAQNLRTLIMTEKGSVPFRPNFGFGAEQLLGGTANDLSIIAELTEQIERYERRVRVKKINLMSGSSIGHRLVRVVYELKSSGEEQAFVIEV